MSAAELISKIGQEKARIDGQRKRAYVDLVRAIASGKGGIEESRAAIVLSETGKTAEQLSEDVAKAETQARIKANSKTLPSKRKRIDEINREIAAHDAELAAAEEKHELATGPLHMEAEQLKADIAGIEQELRSIDELFPDRELLQELRDKRQELDGVRRHLGRLVRGRLQNHVQERLKQQIEDLEKEISDIRAIIEA